MLVFLRLNICLKALYILLKMHYYESVALNRLMFDLRALIKMNRCMGIHLKLQCGCEVSRLIIREYLRGNN